MRASRPDSVLSVAGFVKTVEVPTSLQFLDISPLEVEVAAFSASAEVALPVNSVGHSMVWVGCSPYVAAPLFDLRAQLDSALRNFLNTSCVAFTGRLLYLLLSFEQES